MWNGSWDSTGTLYTGFYTEPVTLNAWVGTVLVLDLAAGRYDWQGVWHINSGSV
jgi:hypothetical protein